LKQSNNAYISLVTRERWIADLLPDSAPAGPHLIELPYLRILSGEWHLLTESNTLLPNHFVSTLDGHNSIYLGDILDKLRRIIKIPTGDKIFDGRFYVMGGSSNYAHWIYDVLPRLFAREEIPAFKDLRIVTDGPLHKYQMEYLKMMGIEASELLQLPYPGSYILQSAVIPSWRSDRSFGLPIDRTPQLKWIRKKLNQVPLPSLGPTTKIYLSRRREQADKRRLANEEMLIPIAEEAGFTVIDTELLTASEQMALFRNASAIMAVHGAAVANILFSPPNARVVEIMNDDFNEAYAPHRWYCATAHMLGQSYRRLTGPPTHSNGLPLNRPAQIDPESFRAALAWAASETDDYPQLHSAHF